MSGQMRHRMTIYAEVSDRGADDPSYQVVRANVPCNIVQVSGGEMYRGRQIEATETYAIETRRFVSWQPTMRIKDQNTGRLLDVRRVLDVDGRRSMVLITATEST